MTKGEGHVVYKLALAREVLASRQFGSFEHFVCLLKLLRADDFVFVFL